MQSPKPPSIWRRASRGHHVSMDKYEKVPLMEGQDSSSVRMYHVNLNIFNFILLKIHASLHSPKPFELNIMRNEEPKEVLIVKPETSPLRTWKDLLIVLVVLLLSETARGIVLPTLAPFVEEVCAF